MTDSYTDRGRIEETKAGYVAPKQITPNLHAARAAYQRLRQNHLKRINLYAEIDGLFQGNPPYNAEELRAAGLNHISNFNDMSARAVLERTSLAYWNLLHNAENLSRFVIRGFNNAPELQQYAQILAKEWDWVIQHRWPSFNVNVCSFAEQLVKFGVSPVVFHDELDPRWRMVELSRFLIPDQAQSDLDQLTMVMIETDYTLQWLWTVYLNEKDQENSPWNTDELGKLLVRLTAGMPGTKTESVDMLDWEHKLQNGDISFDNAYSDTIKLVSMLQKEYDGSVSHVMFHRDENSSEFLFHEPQQYKSINDAVIIFTLNPGAYTIHSNRGIGHKIFSLAQAKIQTDCSVVDMVKWASTPIIKSSSLSTKEASNIRFYPGVPTDIGTADFVQNTIGANVQNVVSAAEYMQSLIQYNISYSGSDPSQPDPDQGSVAPSDARLRAFREFSLLKNNIMHFYGTFDKIIQGMTAKMLRSKEGYPGYELAKEWKERCIEEGVPAAIFELTDKDKESSGLPKHIEVYATRAAGAGSQVAHLIALQELQAIIGSFGPRAEKAYKRQWIMATIGPEYVPMFEQDGDDADENAGGATIAGLENAVMQAGKSPIFSKDNDHRAHFVTHMALAQNTIKSIQQQQMDVIEADSVFTVLIPHLQDHVSALAQNVFAQAFFAQVQPQFEQVARYAELNKKNAARAVQAKIKEQEKQAQMHQQVMTEEQLKTMTTLNEEKRKDIKMHSQLARQQRAADVKEDVLQRKTDADILTTRKKAEADTETSRIKNQLDNNRMQEVEDDPRAVLDEMNGITPAPYDIEKQR